VLCFSPETQLTCPRIDIDELFADTGDQKQKAEGHSQAIKPGRFVSNDRPLDDFRRAFEADDEGDDTEAVLRDMMDVIKENIASSFSRQGFPLALECLRELRSAALDYEEVESYNR
jgi:ATP-dependent DNA helicase 2 subunit 2